MLELCVGLGIALTLVAAILIARWRLEAAAGGQELLHRASANLIRTARGLPIRGLGFVGLTESKMIFAQVVPWQTIEVSLHDVVAVEVANSIDGRRTWSGERDNVLRVRLQNEEFAWQMSEARIWHNRIRDLAERARTS